jgi:hypothetical protein
MANDVSNEHAGNHILTTTASYGVATNLVLYLTQVLHEGNSTAAENYSNWLGTSYLTSLIGAFLSDAYWGRYWTAIIFSTINLFVSSSCSSQYIHSTNRPHGSEKRLSVQLVGGRAW